jgi:hypothetical protein
MPKVAAYFNGPAKSALMPTEVPRAAIAVGAVSLGIHDVYSLVRI